MKYTIVIEFESISPMIFIYDDLVMAQCIFRAFTGKRVTLFYGQKELDTKRG